MIILKWIFIAFAFLGILLQPAQVGQYKSPTTAIGAAFNIVELAILIFVLLHVH